MEITALTLEDWETTVKFYENPNEFENVISTQTVDVSGHLAKKIETSSTGLGSTPRGYAQLIYLIFDSKTPLQIVYKQFNPGDDVNSAKVILEDIAKSVEYF